MRKTPTRYTLLAAGVMILGMLPASLSAGVLAEAIVSTSVSGDPAVAGGFFDVNVSVTSNDTATTPGSFDFEVYYAPDSVEWVDIMGGALGPVDVGPEMSFDSEVYRRVSTENNPANTDNTPSLFTVQFQVLDLPGTPFTIRVDDAVTTATLVGTDDVTIIPHAFNNTATSNIGAQAKVATSVVDGDPGMPGEEFTVCVDIPENPTGLVPYAAAFEAQYTTSTLTFVSAMAGDLGELEVGEEAPLAGGGSDGTGVARKLKTKGNEDATTPTIDVLYATFRVNEEAVYPFSLTFGDDLMSTFTLLAVDQSTHIPHFFDNTATTDIVESVPTPTPSPTPIPTATPTPSPSPSPSPTPSPTPIVEFDFIEGDQGWTPETLPDFFGEPTLTSTPGDPGLLNITATSNTSNFGFWQSPLLEVVQGNEQPVRGATALRGISDSEQPIFRSIWTVTSDQAEALDVPQYRLRVTSEDSQKADVAAFESLADAENSPTDGVFLERDLIFRPAVGSDQMRFQFDLVGFDPRDSASATLSLSSVTVFELTPEQLDGAQVEAEFTFETDEQGWAQVPIPDLFEVPVFDYDATRMALSIQSVPTSGTIFAFWESPDTGEDAVTIEAGRIYWAEFTVSSDQTEADLVPTFRCRLNESDFRAAQLVSIASTGSLSEIPTDGNPVEYDVFFPPDTGAGAQLTAALDLLSLPAIEGTAPDGTIFLHSLRILSVPDPDIDAR